MIKKCERCNSEFICRSDNVFECHCVHVPISQRAQEYLNKNFKNCLCNKCLREVAAKFSGKLECTKE
ncbi:cysteine-rich CWC family protein [Plebeiibacterium marinum]|uniref:Cysteine-rich CWC family protein n=1 Tax=Plebeiibacterium marinum TaxID=2992111 RepID=A0AAE3MCS0_9BACT|nr:cysteine-rich CWC family protein [Plebeiobacterium marinum]MCW3805451.1 cysteine-rich CWC family protein [Plebeiobacterium marinum]